MKKWGKMENNIFQKNKNTVNKLISPLHGGELVDVHRAFLNHKKLYHIRNRKPILLLPKNLYRNIQPTLSLPIYFYLSKIKT